ncbi:MAG: hypothetical protein H0V30_09310 [Chitinophagaceae bacterium]|jgi:uncharacterized membrane protein YbhN (UPF0104 family)|nr:hypothetical protein [Chitinophagaceae bacterium]
MLLSSDEERFIEWWEKNRDNRKKSFRQLMIGLPMATVFVVAILFNFFAGWYKRATMMINTQSSSLILVLLIAGIGIVVFYSIFSMRYKWEMNEQRYQELQAKKHSTKSSD